MVISVTARSSVRRWTASNCCVVRGPMCGCARRLRPARAGRMIRKSSRRSRSGTMRRYFGRASNGGMAANAASCIKEVGNLLWQSGAGARPLRLLVVGPIPYRRTKRSRLYYRRSAFLLTTDPSTPATQLLQVYLDRWEMEVNHRDEKTTLGVGQAQGWSPKSVARQPALVVAAYGALLWASWEVYGATRNEAYRLLPKWRRQSQRPSCLDLVILLRQPWHERPKTVAALEAHSRYQQMILSAAA